MMRSTEDDDRSAHSKGERGVGRRVRRVKGMRASSMRLAIEYRAIADLKFGVRSIRQHSPQQLRKLAAGMRRYGFLVPIVADRAGRVVLGEGRVSAAGQAGIDKIPVILIEHLSEDEIRAFRIAENKLAEMAEWDVLALGAEFRALAENGFDLAFTAFAEKEIQQILAALDRANMTPLVGEDDAPSLPRDAVTQPGDCFAMGRHRLLCGDATSERDVTHLLQGHKPPLMVTDPPYGVDYDAQWRQAAKVSGTARAGRVLNDDRADWTAAYALFPGDVAYVWHAGLHSWTVAQNLTALDFIVRSQIIWVKSRFALSRGHYHWQHEPCFYSVRRGAKSHWQGARDQATTWQISPALAAEDAATFHSTQKPVECMRRPILNSSQQGDSVYDPFCGSGSTLIAAETTRRPCLAMELDPRFCDVTIKRWEALTGKTAIHVATGAKFLDLAEQRLSRGSLPNLAARPRRTRERMPGGADVQS
ncbi:MAG: site-specific DNA-methyltransferase [Alphaproteobacteria bacterium]